MKIKTLTEFESRLVMKKLSESKSEREKFTRYQLMSEVIKGRVSDFINTEFAENLSKCLYSNNNEEKTTITPYARSRVFFQKSRIVAALAIVCICVLSVLFVMNTQYMHKIFNLDANINIAKTENKNNSQSQHENIDHAAMQKKFGSPYAR